MTPRRPISIAAALVGAAAVGAGGGAAVYAGLGNGGTATRTVVRQVTVTGAQPAASTTGLSVGQIYQRSQKGVVEITVTTGGSSSSSGSFPFGQQQTQQAQGSGFVYNANGDIVTNQHVVDGATAIKVTFWNGKSYAATLVGSDASTDLAVIHVDAPASQLFPLQLGDSSALAVGDNVVAIGAPFGLAETATSGIVSALHRQITSPNNFTIDDSIQTDAPINHGNSGGPLLNAQAQVIGVTSQIESDSGGNDGVGFAIPSNTVRSVVTQLIASGKALHAYLGVAVDGTSTAAGATVAQVKSGTPAARAGLKAGDVITSFGGTAIGSPDALQSAVNAHKPGDVVSVTYRRSGTTHTAKITLGTRPTS